MANRLLDIALNIAIAYMIAGSPQTVADGNLGEPCGSNFSCTQENTICQFGFCECPFGYFEDTEAVSCVKGAFNGESCGGNTYCWERNSQCIDGKCICPKGFRHERKECIPEVKKLGEACSAHAQCVTPYARCIDNVCKCEGGLEMANEKCIVKKAHCIAESAPLKDDQPHFCTLQLDGTHDCTDNMECIPSDQPMVLSQGMTITGICCPMSAFEVKKEQGPLKCAVGEEKSATNCYDDHWETHFLISFDLTGETICCPRACTNERIFHDGRCYDSLLHLNDQCEKSFQCFPGEECQDSRCVCGKNRREINGFCYDENCPMGNALMDSRNQTIACVNNPCPKDYVCIREFDKCCPLSINTEEY